ncbi:DUF1534 domain-containing protein [Pseudomonas syringae]|nr:DUF1534 domain-containing protein [Pseudomonas syringae]
MTQSITNGIPTQSMGTIVKALSFLTLQRGNALRGALRHGTADCGVSRMLNGSDAFLYHKDDLHGGLPAVIISWHFELSAYNPHRTCDVTK